MLANGNFDIAYVWFDAEIDGRRRLIGNYHGSDGRNPLYRYAHATTDEMLWNALNDHCLDMDLCETVPQYNSVVWKAGDAWVLQDNKEIPFKLSDIKRAFMVTLTGDDEIGMYSYNFETEEENAESDMSEHPAGTIWHGSVGNLVEYMID